MPCDSIQTATLEVGKMDLKILEAALEAMGKRPQVGSDYVSWDNSQSYYQKGRIFTRTGRDQMAAEVKRAYSTQVVKNQAVRFGWSFKQQPNGKIVLMKGKL